MKKTLVSLAAGAALVATAGMANADGYGYGSVKDAPLAAPQANWNGLYIGAAVGYGIATTEPSVDFAGLGGLSVDGLSSEGFQGTLTIGYDRQVHHNWVIGVFGDYTLGELETDISLTSPEELGISAGLGEITDSWAIGARIGYLHSCCTMWYVAGGYAQADLEALEISKTMDGWFIGGGVEQQLSGNLFLKLDYRYTSYDKEHLLRLGGPEDYLDLDTETDIHSIRLGVNWKVDLFGGHHAAPAYDSLK